MCEAFRLGKEILFLVVFVSLFYRNSLMRRRRESQQDIPKSQFSVSPNYQPHDPSAFPFPIPGELWGSG